MNGETIMKKVLFGILGTAIVLAIGTTSAFAASPGLRRSFIDADSDGIYDNIQNGICSYVDTDADGVCDNRGKNHDNCPAGDGKNFVDEDGDGICENFASDQGKGNGCRNGLHGECGKNFINEDNDSVCDNFTSGQNRGSGHRSDSHQGRYSK